MNIVKDNFDSIQFRLCTFSGNARGGGSTDYFYPFFVGRRLKRSER